MVKFGVKKVKRPTIWNGWWTEWRVDKRKFARWHTDVSELFSGIHVTINFLNGIHIKLARYIVLARSRVGFVGFYRDKDIS